MNRPISQILADLRDNNTRLKALSAELDHVRSLSPDPHRQLATESTRFISGFVRACEIVTEPSFEKAYAYRHSIGTS